MKTNRRKFLSFLPFVAALPFIRIPDGFSNALHNWRSYDTHCLVTPAHNGGASKVEFYKPNQKLITEKQAETLKKVLTNPTLLKQLEDGHRTIDYKALNEYLSG